MGLAFLSALTLAQASEVKAATYACETKSGQIAQLPKRFEVSSNGTQVEVVFQKAEGQPAVTILGKREEAVTPADLNQVVGQMFVNSSMAVYDNFVYANGANYLETAGDTNEETFFVAASDEILTGAPKGTVKVYYDRGFSDGHSVSASCVIVGQ